MGDTTHADDDSTGGWMVLPTPERAAAHATPFPEFEGNDDSTVEIAVYDLNVQQMTRLAAREAEAQ
jgi:hypothetical protein